MPSVSKRQQRFMGADLDRARKGKRTRTGMSEGQLEDYAGTPRKDLPDKAMTYRDRMAKITGRGK